MAKNSKVIKTRTLKDKTIWRRKIVEGKSTTTYERFTGEHIVVQKRNGTKKYFNPYKLFASIFSAYKEGKNADSGDATIAAKTILDQFLQYMDSQEIHTISTHDIAKYITRALKENEHGVALRYSSRYLK